MLCNRRTDRRSNERCQNASPTQGWKKYSTMSFYTHAWWWYLEPLFKHIERAKRKAQTKEGKKKQKNFKEKTWCRQSRNCAGNNITQAVYPSYMNLFEYSTCTSIFPAWSARRKGKTDEQKSEVDMAALDVVESDEDNEETDPSVRPYAHIFAWIQHFPNRVVITPLLVRPCWKGLLKETIAWPRTRRTRRWRNFTGGWRAPQDFLKTKSKSKYFDGLTRRWYCGGYHDM